MTIKDLIVTLRRPVDRIRITTGALTNGEEVTYNYDGFEVYAIPEQILSVLVEKWEVVIDVNMKSLCEVTVTYTLCIN